MKRHFCLFAVICLIVAISCNKEQQPNPDNTDGVKDIVSAVIEEGVSTTRTDYTIGETTATFEWSEGDSFARVCHNNSTFTTVSYEAEAGIVGANGSFSCSSAITGGTNYAFYPNSSSCGADVSVSTNSGGLMTLTIPSLITYDYEKPIKDLIPMIGVKNDDNFSFYPLTGVIGIHTTNIPATATSITLSTTGNVDGLSGTTIGLSSNPAYFSGLHLHDRGLVRDLLGENRGVTLDFSAKNPNGSATFYFPVPPTYVWNSNGDGAENPYTNLTITLKAGDAILSSVSINQNIKVNRAQIVMLPDIAFPHATLEVGGNANDIKVTLTEKTHFSYVKVYAASTLAAAQTGVSDYGTQISNTNVATSINGFVDSGEYYIAYKGYTSAGSPIDYVSGSLGRVFYLSAEDGGNLVGTYTASWDSCDEWGSSNTNNNVKIVAEDCRQGNRLALTYFKKRAYDLTDTPSYSDNVAGTPVYGSVSTIGATQVLTFDASYNKTNDNFFFYSNSWTFYLVGSDTGLDGKTSTTSADNDIVFAVGEEDSKVTLTNSGYIDLIFDWKHDGNWYAFWSYQNLKLTHQ